MHHPDTLSLRRRTLLLAGAAAGSAAAFAQPAATGKVVKIVVGFPPGQATDIVARLMADKLHLATGDNYIVDNKPGQGGSLALGQLAKAPADGSVMMLAHMSALCTNPHMYKSVPYDTLKDFEAVGLVGDLPFVLVCNPGLPVNNVQELIAYAKANPEKLTNASSGNGTVSHLALEEFKRRAGIKITHVPYKGSAQGLTDVVAGNVSMALETAAGVQPFVQGGKLRALGAGTSKRLTGVLAVPTIAEQGFPGFSAVTWLMLLYPAGTPRAHVEATFKAMNGAMQTAEVEQRLLAVGALPRYSKSPGEADAYMKTEFKDWGEVVRRSGTTLD
ncbi:MAG: tripartite tricarboxylate transporter substrate-binding protein [Pseudomonadota bacterium]